MTEPKFTCERHTFSMVCRVEINIQAGTQRVWKLLTDAEGFPRWNSTIIRIEGHIREGERLRLHVPGTNRTFTPKVSHLVPNGRMTWSDGFAPVFKGVRTFVLKSSDANSTIFVMNEHFSGLVFALVKGALPDFGPIFERFATDLKQEAERSP